MKKVLAIFLIAVSVFLFAGCGDNKPKTSEPKSYTVYYVAYVNYFGEVKKYEVASYMAYDSGRVRLKLKDGSHIMVGVNNVILEEK